MSEPMDEYPANSHKVRDVTRDYTNKGRTEGEEEPKKIEKVIEGEVLRRKKPLPKRLAESFVGGDLRTVRTYVLFEVLLPAAKDTLADVVSQGVERMLFGEARSTSRRTGVRPGSRYTPYNQYSQYSKSSSAVRREEPRSISRRSRAAHEFDEIILATSREAQDVIDRLFDLIARYDTATVADLYELVGITGNYTDDKWGWTDIRGAGTTRVRNGYLLDLPRPEPLD